MPRSYRSADFPAGRVLDAKRGRKVSVCIPACDEEQTIGPIVSSIRRRLMDRDPVVDELIVIDDGSSDATTAVAASAGADVYSASALLAGYPAKGKGQAMWRAVHVATGDVVVFCDADIRDFDPGFVLGLAGPLLVRDDVAFVKGFYERPVGGGSASGGRVTELVARPLIAELFPHLAGMVQPLAGECAGRRDALAAVPFAGGYSVDLALLLDISARFGPAAVVQCDLGQRVHRNRPLHELGPQALAILQLALARAGLRSPGRGEPTCLVRPGAPPAAVQLEELPPLASLAADLLTA